MGGLLILKNSTEYSRIIIIGVVHPPQGKYIVQSECSFYLFLYGSGLNVNVGGGGTMRLNK